MSNQQQTATSSEDSRSNQAGANIFIEAFEEADRKLRMAIETDTFSEVKSAEVEVSEAIEALFRAADTQPENKKAILNFLVEKFVLNESAGDILKKRVCNALLAEI